MPTMERRSPGISIRPDVQSGEPCLEGTRFPTRTVRSYVESGWDAARIQGEYPWLTVAQIDTAIRFEAHRQTCEHERWGLGSYDMGDGELGYGYATKGMDPLTFHPDPECATLEEVCRWWFACQASRDDRLAPEGRADG